MCIRDRARGAKRPTNPKVEDQTFRRLGCLNLQRQCKRKGRNPTPQFSLGVVLQMLRLLLLLVLLPLLLLLLLDDDVAAAAAAALLQFCARRASGGVVLQSRCCCNVALVLRPSCVASIHSRYRYRRTQYDATHLYCKLEYVPKHQYPSP